MSKIVNIVDKMLAIDKMLTKLGYDTNKMTVDEILDVKKAIEKAVKQPVKVEYV
jgi:hypothetical protein